MDYEKAYKEALERAEAIKNSVENYREALSWNYYPISAYADYNEGRLDACDEILSFFNDKKKILVNEWTKMMMKH
jgi:hypothetical protein